MPRYDYLCSSRRLSLVIVGFALVSSLGVLFGCMSATFDPADAMIRSDASLATFRSDADLRRYLRQWIPATDPIRRRAPGVAGVTITGSLISGAPALAQAEVTESITNTQETGVDEGGIVKMRGDDILVILRRGRLFTVSISGGGMRSIDMVNAYPPRLDAHDDWYDEMLIARDRLVIIGYSYVRGTTEINRFLIDDEGRIRLEDSYQLRSSDYYSSRNYASRLIGSELILYSPLDFPLWARDPLQSLPAIRHSSADTTGFRFQRIVGAHQVYIPLHLANSQDIYVDTFHTITRCDLAARVLDCEAKTVLGPWGRSTYVSANAVYVWVTEQPRGRAENSDGVNSLIYRLPLNGSPPTAIAARGAPSDQFSFQEDYENQQLSVLVRAENEGDAFWSAERSAGTIALLKIPLDSFGDGASTAESAWYRSLPSPEAQSYYNSFQNRFVGKSILYGFEDFDDPDYNYDTPRTASLVVVPVQGGAVTQLPLEHGVDRIDIMGTDAVVVGTDRWDERSSLHFSAIDLSPGSPPALGDRHVDTDVSQAESRSHAFFFHPDSEQAAGTMGSSGVIGLPIARPGRGRLLELFEDAMGMVFLRHSNKRFTPLGEITAHTEDVVVEDGCVASCLDWYGNSRPIFVNGRVFALMGYELVEGILTDVEIQEIARINYAPTSSSQ